MKHVQYRTFQNCWENIFRPVLNLYSSESSIVWWHGRCGVWNEGIQVADFISDRSRQSQTKIERASVRFRVFSASWDNWTSMKWNRKWTLDSCSFCIFQFIPSVISFPEAMTKVKHQLLLSEFSRRKSE